MSMFNAFLSDAESDGGAAGKRGEPKKVATKKGAKPAPAKSSGGAPKTAVPPQPVSTTKSQVQPTKPAGNNARPERSEHRGEGRGRGGGRGRGSHRPGDVDARGKRYFDKRSGTGRGREAKKSGAGGHNWGSPNEPQYNTNISLSENAEEVAKNIEEKVAEDGAQVEPKVDEEPAEPAEPEKETFTLEQWQSKLNEKRSGKGFEELKAVKVDKVGEGRQYEKKESVEVEDDAEKKLKGKKKGQGRANQRQVFEDIGFQVKEPERRGGFRGGRGGRGAPRGRGRGFGGPRVNPNDNRSFPELGA